MVRCQQITSNSCITNNLHADNTDLMDKRGFSAEKSALIRYLRAIRVLVVFSIPGQLAAGGPIFPWLFGQPSQLLRRLGIPLHLQRL